MYKASCCVAVLVFSRLLFGDNLPSQVTESVNSSSWDYTVTNDEPSGNGNWITSFTLTVDAPISVTSSPANWDYTTDGDTFVSWFNTDMNPPFPHDIVPGASLSGFDISSLDAVSQPDVYYLSAWDHLEQVAGPVVSGNVNVPVRIATTPEPSSAGLMMIVLVLLFGVFWRKWRYLVVVLGACSALVADVVIVDTTAPINPLGWASSGIGQYNFASAQSFISTGNYTLNTINVPIVLDHSPNRVTFVLTEDAGGIPGNELESFTTSAWNQVQGAAPPLTRLTSTRHPLLLANTRYWLVAQASNPSDILWVWNVNDFNSTIAVQTNGGPWQVHTGLYGFMFRITGLPLTSAYPTSIFSDDTGAVGLADTAITNVALTEAGTLFGDIQIRSFSDFWLGVNYINYSSPTMISFAPDFSNSIEGTFAAAGVIPPCSANFLDCQTPGEAAWKAGFASPGTITVDLSVTPLAAALNLLELIVSVPPSEVVGVAQQLYADVPAFKTASDCLVNFSASSFPCISSSFLTLARNGTQRDQVLNIFLQNNIQDTEAELFEQLLGVPGNSLVMLADLGVYLDRTTAAGHAGILEVKMRAQ